MGTVTKVEQMSLTDFELLNWCLSLVPISDYVPGRFSAQMSNF